MDNRNNTPSMEMEARAYLSQKGNTLGYASLTINGCFAVNGIRIMNGENGPFAAMPGRKDKDGNYRDICFPTTKELREEINSLVVDAYYAELEKGLAGRDNDSPAKEPKNPSMMDNIETGAKEAAKTNQPEKPAPAKTGRGK